MAFDYEAAAEELMEKAGRRSTRTKADKYFKKAIGKYGREESKYIRAEVHQKNSAKADQAWLRGGAIDRKYRSKRESGGRIGKRLRKKFDDSLAKY